MAVKIIPSALYFLMTQMEGLGIHRSGPLFGHCIDGNLVISVARCGQPRPNPYDPSPLSLDGDYILGLSDGLRAADPGME